MLAESCRCWLRGLQTCETQLGPGFDSSECNPDLASFELVLPPVDDVEVIVSEPTPLLLGSALELLPVSFDSIPVHEKRLRSSVSPETWFAANTEERQQTLAETALK